MQIASPPFTDILVPLDGSPGAERALGPALDLVTRTGVPLRVLRRVLPDEAEEGATYLAELADRYAGLTDLETQIVEAPAVAEAIVDGRGPDTLVCMTSHGRGGVARAVMGSVAEEVLRLLDRPALVIGPLVDERALLTGRIVACVDGSRESERALGPAQRWSRALDLPLWLTEVSTVGTLTDPSGRGDTTEAARLVGLARRLGDVEGWDVLHGRHPARALADMAEDTRPWATAVLVMATHGRTGWDRLRLGSVTTTTIHHAPRPVLVVPAVSPPDEVGDVEPTSRQMTGR
jgi:nucleotide-binding universal stress UspA family protein